MLDKQACKFALVELVPLANALSADISPFILCEVARFQINNIVRLPRMFSIFCNTSLGCENLHFFSQTNK